MSALPHGYISKKTIKGKQYYYLQSRIEGKLVSKYLKEGEVDGVLKQIELYKEYKAAMPKFTIRLRELEQAAQLLDKNIARELMLQKVSIGMDELSATQKDDSISFATAMNAIEGVSISKQTELDIADWRNGEKTFIAIFQNTLKRYGFASEA